MGKKMSKPIVIQLQELSSSGNENATDLLRKALIVATKLDLPGFKDWISNELNGYKPKEKIPEYRRLRGEVKIENPYHGLVPVSFASTEFRDIVSTIQVAESIPSIIKLMDSPGGNIVYYFSPEQERRLAKLMTGPYMKPLRVVESSSMSGIVEIVKTKILEWSLQLESEGILGENLTFTNHEKEVAMTSKVINITNFQGVLGDVTGGSVIQTNTVNIERANFESLKNHLREAGVDETSLSELETALNTDPVPQGSGAFGVKVSEWIGNMISKASIGTWEIGVAVAADLLAQSIGKYYGMN